MNKFTKKFISGSTELGRIILDPKNNKLLFDTHIRNPNGTIKRKSFIQMGDVVYAFLYDKRLYKFGKASGAAGWYDRAGQYMKHGESLDKTSKKIINYMRENKIAEFSVHAIKSPKQLISVKCPVSDTTVNMYVETAHMMEQHLIQEAYSAGETLPLCQEVKK